MKVSYLRKRRILAFTLVELLVVIGIIALLVGVFLPNVSMSILRAQSVKCAVNLRSIGVAATQASADNNGQYPEINQTAPPLPYPASVQGLVGVLGPYGISTASVQCPVDMANGASSSFQKYGSSYEWNPVFDDENPSDPVIYPTPNNPIQINSSRVRLCTDFVPLHHNKVNALYGDGHVSAR